MGKERLALTEKQQLIMQCIWDKGGEAIKQDIIRLMEEKYDITMTRQALNMSTQALIEKGYLTVTEKVVNAYVYKATISREDFQVEEMRRVREITFGGAAGEMLSTLIKTGVTKENLRTLREMLQKFDG